MGQYKVPQDVEAEDKLIGPLSLRQFIYVVIGVAWAGLMYLIFNRALVVMGILILPVTGFFLIMGFGRRQEQSFETYFVALIKFMIEPRVRVWDKDLTQEVMVQKIEKPVEIIPTKTLNRGSLKQLALIMDTHGTQKDPTLQLQDDSNLAIGYGQRIINPQQVVQQLQQPTLAPGQVSVPSGNIPTNASQKDDVLDMQGVRGKEVNQLLEDVEADIRTDALDKIKKGLAQPTGTTPNQKPLFKQSSNAIIKRVVSQGNNLTVAQLAKEANTNTMVQGQAIKLNQAS